jgi:hypothetical protein
MYEEKTMPEPFARHGSPCLSIMNRNEIIFADTQDNFGKAIAGAGKALL